MIILKLIRLILPPFHPLKYKYINWYYGNQNGGYFMEEQKYKSSFNTTNEKIINDLHDKF
jgi:hypothetical protein